MVKYFVRYFLYTTKLLFLDLETSAKKNPRALLKLFDDYQITDDKVTKSAEPIQFSKME